MPSSTPRRSCLHPGNWPPPPRSARPDHPTSPTPGCRTSPSRHSTGSCCPPVNLTSPPAVVDRGVAAQVHPRGSLSGWLRLNNLRFVTVTPFRYTSLLLPPLIRRHRHVRRDRQRAPACHRGVRAIRIDAQSTRHRRRLAGGQRQHVPVASAYGTFICRVQRHCPARLRQPPGATHDRAVRVHVRSARCHHRAVERLIAAERVRRREQVCRPDTASIVPPPW